MTPGARLRGAVRVIAMGIAPTWAIRGLAGSSTSFRSSRGSFRQAFWPSSCLACWSTEHRDRWFRRFAAEPGPVRVLMKVFTPDIAFLDRMAICFFVR